MALDVIFLATVVEFHRFHVVGVSMGGMIAQHVALTVPEVREGEGEGRGEEGREDGGRGRRGRESGWVREGGERETEMEQVWWE